MERVKLCEDGKYRWIYKMSTLKNPSMMIRMGKILGVTLLVIFFIAYLVTLTGEGEKPFLQTVEMLLPAFAILIAVYVVSYLLWVLLCGGTYVCAFEMDDAGILHAQGKNKTKNHRTDDGTAGGHVAGDRRAGRRPDGIGQFLLEKQLFAVTSLKARRRYNAIYLNEPGCKNIIYVDDRDFDFVWNFIKARCDKAKTNEGDS